MNETTKPLPPGSPAAILIVDDEPPLRDVLAQLLAGYHVATADNGRSALDMLKQAHYALVITDLMMPQVDGFTVLRAAKQIDATTEVLVITGYPSAENERRCRELGCFDVVAKPFSVAAVRDRVDQCLKKSQGAARPT